MTDTDDEIAFTDRFGERTVSVQQFLEMTNDVMADPDTIRITNELLQTLGIRSKNNPLVSYMVLVTATSAFIQFMEAQGFNKRVLLARTMHLLTAIKYDLAEILSDHRPGNA